jgi:hypothetical protein
MRIDLQINATKNKFEITIKHGKKTSTKKYEFPDFDKLGFDKTSYRLSEKTRLATIEGYKIQFIAYKLSLAVREIMLTLLED